MRFRFTIGKKIGLGFSSLVLATLIVFVITAFTLINSKRTINTVLNLYNPSVAALTDLNLLVVRSKMLISSWVSIQSGEDNEDKQRLIKLLNTEYPNQKKKILSFSQEWKPDEKEQIGAIFHDIDSLLQKHKYIMGQLNSFDAYENPMILFPIQPMIKGGEIDMFTNVILNRLEEVIEVHKGNAEVASNHMITSFNQLQNVVIISGITLVLGGILISLLTVKTIVTPVYAIRDILLSMSKGILPKAEIPKRSDEIGEMAVALNKHVEGQKRTIDFSSKVGAGNFNEDHQPLSNQDRLSHTLLRMRDDLKDLTHNLEQKVKERTEEVVKQKEIIEHKSNQINDSINYAKRIQESILPDTEIINKTLPKSFILYKPKDIVSGDFPWYVKVGNSVYIAAVDCTGHGVPGALLSLIGYFLLNDIVKSRKTTDPAKILDQLDAGVTQTLRQDVEGARSKDGMDIALCKIDLTNNEVEFSGAHRPLYVIKNKELIEIKGNKFAIGGGIYKNQTNFTNHKITLDEGDSIFFFSDGFPDQFGGPQDRKYGAKRMRRLIAELHSEPIKEVYKTIDASWNDWKGMAKQIDDVLLIGIKFNKKA